VWLAPTTIWLLKFFFAVRKAVTVEASSSFFFFFFQLSCYYTYTKMASDDSSRSENELKNIQEVEEMEEEPVPLEDLDASDIDDEDGDLILEQKITINNEV
jgi:hypothetical protein